MRSRGERKRKGKRKGAYDFAKNKKAYLLNLGVILHGFCDGRTAHI
jgi:hypothetical protein